MLTMLNYGSIVSCHSANMCFLQIQALLIFSKNSEFRLLLVQMLSLTLFALFTVYTPVPCILLDFLCLFCINVFSTFCALHRPPSIFCFSCCLVFNSISLFLRFFIVFLKCSHSCLVFFYDIHILSLYTDTIYKLMSCFLFLAQFSELNTLPNTPHPIPRQNHVLYALPIAFPLLLFQ